METVIITCTGKKFSLVTLKNGNIREGATERAKGKQSFIPDQSHSIYNVLQ